MTTAIEIANIWKYDLRRGSSDHPSNGACLFDAGMWLVYGRIGDNPPCSCPVIRAYGIGLNDRMNDEERQMLKPFILRIVGNRDSEAEAAREHYIVLETARRIVPLLLTKWPQHQARLLALPDNASYGLIKEVCREAAAATAYAYATAYAANAIAHATAYAYANAYATAYAANAIAHVADATTTYAVKKQVWSEAINILDGVLQIGKQAPDFDEVQVRESVRQFELAGSK